MVDEVSTAFTLHKIDAKVLESICTENWLVSHDKHFLKMYSVTYTSSIGCAMEICALKMAFSPFESPIISLEIFHEHIVNRKRVFWSVKE